MAFSVARCGVGLGPITAGNNATVGVYTYGTGDGPSGDGIIAVLEFQPSGIEGRMPLHINYAILTDIHGNPIASQTQDDFLTIGEDIFQDSFE